MGHKIDWIGLLVGLAFIVISFFSGPAIVVLLPMGAIVALSSSGYGGEALNALEKVAK